MELVIILVMSAKRKLLQGLPTMPFPEGKALTSSKACSALYMQVTEGLP